jgi:hypothetical protein
MLCSSITPSAGKAVGHPEKRRVALVAESLERADRHDAINGFVELFPALQRHTKAARGVHRVEHLLHVRDRSRG